MKALLARKMGMTRLFDEDGTVVPVTLLHAGDNVVVQIKTDKNDGYEAIQIGFGDKSEKACTKPLLGHFKKAKIAPHRRLSETRVDSTEGMELGQTLNVSLFAPGEKVDVTSVSKGLGTQGTVRRHKFATGPKTHGQSDRWRSPGSIGQASYPARVFKGMRMAGHMGGVKVTVKNLRVYLIDEENGVIGLKGAVPGKRNSIVKIWKR